MVVSLEVCVDSILSAKNASDSGVERIELCSALSEGGLTPSLGLFLGVKKSLENSKTKIFCMIRIRRGDFVYSKDEIEAMVEDVRIFKEKKADGIVFGCLTEENQINVEDCQELISAWGSSKPKTFHRAFDETREEDLEKNIDILALLGFSRILSSGFEPTASAGIKNLKLMNDYSLGKGISIMCGAGVNKNNVASILTETGCNEVHSSARSEKKLSCKLSMGGGSEDMQPLMICDPVKVKEIMDIIKSFTS